jgi:hypothetical protein
MFTGEVCGDQQALQILDELHVRDAGSGETMIHSNYQAALIEFEEDHTFGIQLGLSVGEAYYEFTLTPAEAENAARSLDAAAVMPVKLSDRSPLIANFDRKTAARLALELRSMAKACTSPYVVRMVRGRGATA